MKITDFAMIFVGITLPIIIIVYINISFTIKAEEQELYYQKIVDTAIHDATVRMKEVESEYKDIDYGYSGIWNKKISVNAKIAVDAFFNSMYNNLGIAGSTPAETYLQLFVPAIAVIDYNGVQVSSIESYTDVASGETRMKHVLKPKKFYTYTYMIQGNGAGGYSVIDDLTLIQAAKTSLNYRSIHTVEFTMDDYVSHRGDIYSTAHTEMPLTGFYIEDSSNNDCLVETGGLSPELAAAKQVVIAKLKEVRKNVIARTVMDEMSYAVNKNNSYAHSVGVTYTFSFPQSTMEDWYDNVENVGIIAFMQGISVGNKYLNYKAYGITNLTQTTKFYLTTYSDTSKYKMNLYHKDARCPEYIISIKTTSPEFTSTKQEAASMSARALKNGSLIDVTGFSPCPICNP